MCKYEDYLGCLSGILGNCCCCCAYINVHTAQVALKRRFGKFVNVLQPGLHYLSPLTESSQTLSLKTTVVDMQNQIIYTKDNISIQIDTALFYRIIDPYKAYYEVVDVLQSLLQMTYVTMRAVCGEYTLQDLLMQKARLNEQIGQYLSRTAFSWGVYVEHLVLKDMRLNNELASNLSKVSQTRRAIESQIISAQADLESAKLYRQASDLLDIKAAVQIRFLQTLEQMNAMESKRTVIIPLKPNLQLG